MNPIPKCLYNFLVLILTILLDETWYPVKRYYFQVSVIHCEIFIFVCNFTYLFDIFLVIVLILNVDCFDYESSTLDMFLVYLIKDVHTECTTNN